MIVLESFVHTDIAKAVGWTIVNSLWEGVAIALVLFVALGTLRSSNARYLAASIALMAMTAASAVTFVRIVPQHVLVSNPAVLNLQHVPAPDGVMAKRPLAERAATLLPWLTPFWIAGVLAFYLRMLASWFVARRLTRTGVCAADSVWQQTMTRLRARLSIARPVKLLESCLTDVPVVLGYLRPIVLMPAGALVGLPAGQIEAILLHELAHIRRADYVVNLLQTFVESLFFYHPGVWWISRVIRAERENCCDDLVVETQGDARQYAAALAAFEEYRYGQTVLAATGGNLMRRMERILGRREEPRAGFAPVFSAAIILIGGALLLTAWQSPTPTAGPAGRYANWVNQDVVYIITAQERMAFEKLGSDAERDEFVSQFWLRRDPTPGTEENEYKEEHYRRIAWANSRFSTMEVPGWKTDRGRIYIQYGPPDEIDAHLSGGSAATYPYEDWRYLFIQGVGSDVNIRFVDTTGSGDFRMTLDPNAKDAERYVAPTPQ